MSEKFEEPFDIKCEWSEEDKRWSAWVEHPELLIGGQGATEAEARENTLKAARAISAQCADVSGWRNP